MGIDINTVHQFARALAIRQRNEQNRRHPGSRDPKHETWEETNRNAAKMTIAILMIAFIIKILIKFLRYLGRMSIKAFGPKWGRVINIIGLLAIVLFVPTCSIVVESNSGDVTTNDIYQQQRDKREAKEREEIKAYKARARSEVEMDAKARGIDGERLDVVLNTFDGKVCAYSTGNAISKKDAEAGIDRSKRECWEELPKYDAPLIEAYLEQRLSELRQQAQVKIEILKNAGSYEKVPAIEYQIRQVDNLKHAGVTGKIFEEAKVLIDKIADEALREIKRQEKEDESINRIREYLDQKLSDVKQVAKVRMEKLKGGGHWEKVPLVEYQVEQVDNLKYAGRINTTVFEEAKAIIDKAVNNAIKEIGKY